MESREFAGDMEVCGDAMQCKFCSCPVKFAEKSTAKKHVESNDHKDNKLNKLKNAKLVVQSSLSAFVGLVQKYTKAMGCVPQHNGLYVFAKRVGTFHCGAIQAKFPAKRFLFCNI